MLYQAYDSSIPADHVDSAELEASVNQLPLDLLRGGNQYDPSATNFDSAGLLFVRLNSLQSYVATLDENSLHRYTDRLHQVVYTAAGFYGGELHVVRQFGLAVFFSGDTNAGSAAFRAACCAWLVKSANTKLEKQMPLSLTVAMAVSQSELGMGDGSDIYPGLYMQHTLDELQTVCASRPPKILLSPPACADVDISGRLQTQATEVNDYAMLEAFASPYNDLLERQLRLLLRRLAPA